jgi:hypothetical protein
MHGLEELPGYAFLICLAVAFAIELSLNRRPLIVAFAVPSSFSALLIAISAVESGRTDSVTITIILAIFGVGGLIGSLIGSGTARALRLWIALRRDEKSDE